MMGLRAVRAVTVNISSLAEISALWMMCRVNSPDFDELPTSYPPQDQVAQSVGRGLKTMRDDDSRGRFLDNRWAGKQRAQRKTVPAKDRRLGLTRITPEDHSST